MKPQVYLTFIVATYGTGCIECDCTNPTAGFCVKVCSDGSETGGVEPESGNLVCTFDGKCLLNRSVDDPIVQQAIELGMFAPYTEFGSCPDPVWRWAALGQFYPTIPAYLNDEWSYFPIGAYCPNMDNTGGYQGPTGLPSPASSFPICWPETAAWFPVWEQGAVARPGPTIKSAECDWLPDYGWLYSWDYAMDCSEVYCIGFDDECACRCTGDTTCTTIEKALEAKHGELGELICQGYPYRPPTWSGGSWMPSSCVWNNWSPPQPAQPLGRPLHLLDLVAEVSCTGVRSRGQVDCALGADLRGRLESPDAYTLLDSGVRWHLEGHSVVLDEVNPASVLGHIGLVTGDAVVVDADTLEAALDMAAGLGDLRIVATDATGASVSFNLSPL